MSREQKESINSSIMKQICKIAPSGAIVLLLLLLFFRITLQAQVLDSSQIEGIEVKTLYSKILGEKRTIRIRMPIDGTSYDRYPVIYVFDGESFTSLIAGQVQYLSESYKIIPNLIV